MINTLFIGRCLCNICIIILNNLRRVKKKKYVIIEICPDSSTIRFYYIIMLQRITREQFKQSHYFVYVTPAPNITYKCLVCIYVCICIIQRTTYKFIGVVSFIYVVVHINGSGQRDERGLKRIYSFACAVIWYTVYRTIK